MSTTHAHDVGLYDSDAHLVRSVAEYLTGSSTDDAAAVIIGTAAHRGLICEALAARGVDIETSIASGALTLRDAAETLALFMTEDRPDPVLFRETIGGVLRTASDGGRRSVRAFGEMVALLWADGNVQGAIDLEDLWNALAATIDFSLYCAYPVSAFAGDDSSAPFDAMCALHRRVVPSESFAPGDRDAELLAIAQLQRERAALENTRRVLQAELERVQDLDQLRNKFLAMVVHDIRSPAAVTRGYLNLLEESWAELGPPTVNEFLRTCIGNVRQIEKLADDMSTIARLESGTFTYEPTSVSLTGLIHRVANELRVATGRTIDTTDVAAQPRVWADEDRQSQILTNLLSNAIKFSTDDAKVRISLDMHDDHLVVSVSDSGPGFTPSELGQLFRPFARLPQPEGTTIKGSGLGLYIVKALVEGQGGSISVTSTKGSGATFSYTVPLAQAID